MAKHICEIIWHEIMSMAISIIENNEKKISIMAKASMAM